MAEVPATDWDENGGGWPVERFARSFSADQSQFLITFIFMGPRTVPCKCDRRRRGIFGRSQFGCLRTFYPPDRIIWRGRERIGGHFRQVVGLADKTKWRGVSP